MDTHPRTRVIANADGHTQPLSDGNICTHIHADERPNADQCANQHADTSHVAPTPAPDSCPTDRHAGTDGYADEHAARADAHADARTTDGDANHSTAAAPDEHTDGPTSADEHAAAANRHATARPAGTHAHPLAARPYTHAWPAAAHADAIAMMYTAGKPHSLLERLYASLGEHSGKQLFNEIVRAKSLKPRLTLAKLLAIPIAAIVHLLNLAVALAGLAITALGVTMIVNVWPNLAQLMFASIWTGIGLTILGAVWLARPQLLRQAHGALAREQFPTVYRMADQVAQALGSSNVDAIVIDWNFNAAFTHVGWPRKKVLHLGLPLLVVIDEREVVALLAHELAHGVNGDPNRGLFVGAAVDSLVAWADLFWRPQRWSEDLIQSILALFLLPPFVMPWLLSLILIHLLWRDQQRAEYLADYLAAQVSGTEAMISMLGKLHLHDIFTQTVLRAVRRRVPPTYNLFDDIRREFATARPIGLEETDSLAALGELRLDSTHPPTPYRVAFLKSRPAPTPKVAFSNCDLDQLRQELAPLQPYIQDSLLRAFYRAAYY